MVDTSLRVRHKGIQKKEYKGMRWYSKVGEGGTQSSQLQNAKRVLIHFEFVYSLRVYFE